MKLTETSQALARATGLDPEIIEAVMRKEQRQGFVSWLERKRYVAFGFRFTEMRDFGMKGSYICVSGARVWAVVDGVAPEINFQLVFKVEAIA